ncbi:hypothetical protein FJT64_018746 [Amphibalanus amphitrite]|uniref:Peptidase A2 domain-containing protein n=1 Tax=Amphibalanus amphitrite TaxID=1232801 RepID=A0A6A4X7A2_AMPAM|nr:hypothetical protein FJT64_018746 [Amphibalanus amphitrite]
MSLIPDAGLATAGKPCVLGTDPARYHDIFEEWLEHASLLVNSLGVTDDTQKLNLLLLWGGRDLRKLAKVAGVDTESDPPTTFKAAIVQIRAHCRQHVNLSMAVFRLMHARQGEKTVTEFLDELDSLATQCQFDTNPYTPERAKKDAFIFGTSDERLRQEALARDPDLQTLVKSALGYEQARKSSGAIQSEVGESVARVATRGRYSINQPTRTPSGQGGRGAGPRVRCKNCPPHYRPHPPGRCPARGKTCALCGEKNHFVGAASCTKAQVRFTAEDDEEAYQFEVDDKNSVGRVVEVGMIQPGHANVVQVSVNGTATSFFVDSGCNKTLIPVSAYHASLGKLEASSVKLRPYGTATLLRVKGEMRATLQSRNGAQCHTTVYIIDGHLAEPLLGDADAKALGILHIDAGGSAREGEPPGHVVGVAGIVDTLAAAGVTVQAKKCTSQDISGDDRRKIAAIVNKHKKVFEGVGLLKDDEVSFHIDPEATPTQEFQYQMVHLPGKANPCDYASRHPMPLSSYHAAQLDDMILYRHDEICINAVISDDTPDAINIKEVQEATARDPQSQKLIKCIQQGYITRDPDLDPFRQIFREFSFNRGKHDARAKDVQKAYKDTPKNVRPHNIQTGDTVLLQRRSTKTASRYDPEPYKVVQMKGTQITATRGGSTLTRDSQKFKRIVRPQRPNYKRQRFPLTLHGNSDEPRLGSVWLTPPATVNGAAGPPHVATAETSRPAELPPPPPTAAAPPSRRSARARRLPSHLAEYDLS